MTEAETKEAMFAYKAGDKDAFGKLFKAYRKTILNWCFRELENMDDAEDVAQIVWLDLATYLLHFEPTIHFKNIAYRVSRNRSLDYIRNRDTRAEILLPPEELAKLYVYDPGSPEADLMVNDMLSSLSNEDRVLVIAKVFDGYSDEELADKLGVAESTLRRQINRVFERLRAIHKDRVNA